MARAVLGSFHVSTTLPYDQFEDHDPYETLSVTNPGRPHGPELGIHFEQVSFALPGNIKPNTDLNSPSPLGNCYYDDGTTSLTSAFTKGGYDCGLQKIDGVAATGSSPDAPDTAVNRAVTALHNTGKPAYLVIITSDNIDCRLFFYSDGTYHDDNAALDYEDIGTHGCSEITVRGA